MEVDAIAERVQAWLAELVGDRLPIVRRPDEAAGRPRLLVSSSSYGDPYSGYTTTDRLNVVDVERAGVPLQIAFCCAVHELSGQCDEWRVEIAGARESERARLWELFHPRQRTGVWSDHAQPTFCFDGANHAYERDTPE